ncbi:MAG: glycosyltransferase family 4 protein, partial [Ferruginibacter sp.]|nr:glycosyltransferase family 4 protein [Ferruginibacter sp.]
DPVPHIGESEFKKQSVKKIYFYLKPNIQLFSQFSKTAFISRYGNRLKTFASKLLPYKSYSLLQNDELIKKYKIDEIKKDKKVILLFGRVSQYKGVNIYLKAIKYLIDDLKKQNLYFMLLGKPVHSFLFSEDEKNMMADFRDHFLHINDYLDVAELAAFIKKSDLIVCPYIEATQSGVIMTSYGLSKPVIATNVGAFPEYVISEDCLVEPNNHVNLALSILSSTDFPIAEESMYNLVRNNELNNINIINFTNDLIYA